MSELSEVAKLIAIVQQKEQKIELLEEELKFRKEEVRRILQEDVPAAMQEMGYQELSLIDGTKIKLKRDVYAKIDDENREAALSWLEANGQEGIIKGSTELSFAKGENEKMMRVAEFLNQEEIDHVFVRTVHPQTLMAFLREQVLHEGKTIPLDLFKAGTYTEAKITKGNVKFTFDED